MRRRLVDLTYKSLALAHELKGTPRSESIAEALRQSLILYRSGRDRYDFHHLALGALCCLFPGAIGRFGRWQTFDSLVNYDPTQVFTKGEMYFLRAEDGTYLFVPSGQERTDGSLFFVSGTPEGRVHPSDNLARRRLGEVLKEMFVPGAKTPILDAADARDSQLIRDALLKIAPTVRGARLADFAR